MLCHCRSYAEVEFGLPNLTNPTINHLCRPVRHRTRNFEGRRGSVRESQPRVGGQSRHGQIVEFTPSRPRLNRENIY